MTSSDALSITAVISGRTIGRAEVLAWEDQRITAAARKLGVPVPPGGDIGARREALLRAKIELGSAEIVRRLRRDIAIADLLAVTQARLSRRRRCSVTDLRVTGGSAAEFVTWFDTATAESDEVAMLRACPDHFLIRTGYDGRQEVVETTGGSPVAARFFVDYDESSGLVTPADRNFPLQIAGVARDAQGRPLGGVRHQFRDTGDGFHAQLTVEFPLPTLQTMVSRHRWHLACEFSNWITAAHSAT